MNDKKDTRNTMKKLQPLKNEQDYRAIARSNTIRHLSQLIGKTVQSLTYDNHDSSMDIYGLKFTDGTLAWIVSDPEQNGPGFLSIKKSKILI